MSWLSADEDWQIQGPVRLRAAIILAKSSGWWFRPYWSEANLHFRCRLSNQSCALNLRPPPGFAGDEPTAGDRYAEDWALDLRRALSRCPHGSAQKRPPYDRAERLVAMAEHLLTIVEDSTDAPPDHPDNEDKPSMELDERQDLFEVALLNVIDAERILPPLFPFDKAGKVVTPLSEIDPPESDDEDDGDDGDDETEYDEDELAVIHDAERELNVTWANTNVPQLRVRIAVLRAQIASLRAQNGDDHL